MILSVAATVKDEATRKTLCAWDKVRKEALDLSYMVDGYEGLPLEEKNKIYGMFRDAVATKYGLLA